MSKYIIEEKRLLELLEAEHEWNSLDQGRITKQVCYGDCKDDYIHSMKEWNIKYRNANDFKSFAEIDLQDLTKLDNDINNKDIITSKEIKENDIEKDTLPHLLIKYEGNKIQINDLQSKNNIIVEKIKCDFIRDWFYENFDSDCLGRYDNEKSSIPAVVFTVMVDNKVWDIHCTVTETDSTDGGSSASIQVFVTDFEIDINRNPIVIDKIFTTKEKDSD